MAALLVLALAAWLLRPRPGGEATATVARDDLLIEVEVTGVLEAARSALLGPPALPGMWSFEIAGLADEGETVAAGETVIRFDPSELERTLEEKLSEQEQAAKELEKATSDLALRRREIELRLAEARARRRVAALQLERSSDVVAAIELARSRLDHRLAEREVGFRELQLDLLARQQRAETAALLGKRDRAAARVAEIREQIGRLEVTAPAAGTVIYVEQRSGEKKKIGDGVWRSQKILEIPDLDRMVGRGQVEEAQAARVTVGQEANLRLDAYPDREYRGRVARVERTVRRRTEGDPAKVFRLDLELESTDTRRMRPGMRFTGRIETDRLPDRLLVPLEAVFPAPGGPVVWVRGLAGWRRSTPTLGRRGAAGVEVVAGLREGDRVSLVPRGGGLEER